MTDRVNPLDIKWDLIPYDIHGRTKVGHNTAACRLPALPEEECYTVRMTLWFHDNEVATVVARGPMDTIKSLKRNLTIGHGWSIVCTWYFDGKSVEKPHGPSHPG